MNFSFIYLAYGVVIAGLLTFFLWSLKSLARAKKLYGGKDD